MDPLAETNNARYYANPTEQQILINGLQRYFSLPERSQNRNKIAKEVSQFLRCFSPHWTHRAVRLWFNNNKHSYFQSPNSNQKNFDQINPIPTIINQRVPLNFQIKRNPMHQETSQITPNRSMPIQNVPPNIEATPYSFAPKINSKFDSATNNSVSKPNPPSENVIPNTKFLNEKGNKNELKQNEKPKIQQLVLPQISLSTFKSETDISRKPQIVPDINPNPEISSLPIQKFHSKILPTPQISTPIRSLLTTSDSILKNPIGFSTSKHEVKIMPPIQMSSFIASHSTTELPKYKEVKHATSTENQLTNEIKNTLGKIRATDESNPELNEQIDYFDELWRDYRTRFGFLSPQIIDPSMKFVRFPVSRPQLPSFSLTENEIDTGFMYNDNSPSFNTFGSMSGFGSSFSLSGISPSTSLNLSNADMLSGIDISSDSRQSSMQPSLPVSSFYMCSGNTDGSSLGSFGSLSNLLMSTSQDSSSSKNLITETSSNQSPSSPCSMSNSIDADISDTQSVNSTLNQSQIELADHYSTNQLWQTRSYKDTYIPYHECTAISQNMDIAAYVSRQLDFTGPNPKRMICFTRVDFDQNIEEDGYNSDKMHDSWATISVDSKGAIESMVVESNFAYLLTNQEIIKVKLIDENNQQSFEVPQTNGDMFLSIFETGANSNFVFAGFTSSSNISLMINNEDECYLDEIKTRYHGISAITSLGPDKLVCGVPLSGTARLVNFHGEEIRSFVGHCGSILSLYNLQSNATIDENYLFASRSDDNTVRVWDIRDRIPIYQITSSTGPLSNLSSSYSSFLTICGSIQFLVLGFHNQIGVVDIRKDFAKPLLSISTGDYDPISMCFNQHLNSISLFGHASNLTPKDSMLFVGNDGQSHKRIFRTYDNILV